MQEKRSRQWANFDVVLKELIKREINVVHTDLSLLSSSSLDACQKWIRYTRNNSKARLHLLGSRRGLHDQIQELGHSQWTRQRIETDIWNLRYWRQEFNIYFVNWFVIVSFLYADYIDYHHDQIMDYCLHCNGNKWSISSTSKLNLNIMSFNLLRKKLK